MCFFVFNSISLCPEVNNNNNLFNKISIYKNRQTIIKINKRDRKSRKRKGKKKLSRKMQKKEKTENF